MRNITFLTVAILLFACSNKPPAVDTNLNTMANKNIKQLIDSLVATIDDNYDPLHSDITPSVLKLSEMGIPAINAVIPLLDSPDRDTRLHAQSVVEGVIARMNGFIHGQGYTVEKGDEKTRKILNFINYNWSDTVSGNRKEAIARLKNWLTNRHYSDSFGNIDTRQTNKIFNKNISDTISTGWYYISEADNAYKRQLDKTTEFFFINPVPIITAKNFTKVNILEIQESKNHNVLLTFTLDKQGQNKWTEATGKALNKKVAFILNNQLLNVQQIYTQEYREWIQTIWDNDKYTRKELENFKTIIENESIK